MGRKKTAGERLVEDLSKALGEEFDWSEQEAAVLELIRAQADDIETLEAAVAVSGPIVPGSKGQDRINPAIQELRLQRAALARLVGLLEFPEEEPERPLSRAQRAAHSRWAKAKGVRS